MREFGLKIAESRQIAFRTEMPAQLPDRSLRPDQRRNIYLIFKEAVNNAVKYSNATEITVRLTLYVRQLHLEIIDNGQGFDPATVQYGNGVANMRLRASEIGGRLDLYTQPGQGVRLVLVAPLP
jgi:signal transduction histidine kinase